MDKNIIYKVVVPIICAVIGLAGGVAGANHHYNKQIVQVTNIFENSSIDFSSADDLEEMADVVIDEYTNAIENHENSSKENNDLQKNIELLSTQNNTLSSENESLRTENESFKEENEKLKDFLLKDNEYADDIDDLVVVKKTNVRLNSLHVIDSMDYEVVDAFTDLHGDSHSVSYKFWPYNGTAWVQYKLNKNYDIFNASIATTQELGRNVKLRVEIYVDGELRTAEDEITRDTNLLELEDIAVRNCDKLEIKVIVLDGYSSYAYCYITDDSLSVV